MPNQSVKNPRHSALGIASGSPLYNCRPHGDQVSPDYQIGLFKAFADVLFFIFQLRYALAGRTKFSNIFFSLSDILFGNPAL
ncbi:MULTISPECIES: hypothetical protein [Edwardsiella]|uniref:hypothetical protein n=1 Tax=Edwardsiella TaxID=635 RepID=UPI00030ED98F